MATDSATVTVESLWHRSF